MEYITQGHLKVPIETGALQSAQNLTRLSPAPGPWGGGAAFVRQTPYPLAPARKPSSGLRADALRKLVCKNRARLGHFWG